MMTGESTPVEVSPGMKVIGSALNNNGRLIVRATRVGSDTELARITSMVVTAQGNKAPIQAYADKIASFFVPLVTLLAIATFAFWFYLDDQSLTFAISTAITVLVIACPCALGLATPVALLVLVLDLELVVLQIHLLVLDLEPVLVVEPVLDLEPGIVTGNQIGRAHV